MPLNAHDTDFTPPAEINPDAAVNGLPPLGMDADSVRQDTTPRQGRGYAGPPDACTHASLALRRAFLFYRPGDRQAGKELCMFTFLVQMLCWAAQQWHVWLMVVLVLTVIRIFS